MSDYLKALIYGIVEGVTEWLPISSTGHLILMRQFLPINVSTPVWNLLLVLTQLGAILGALILFWQKVCPFKKFDKTKGLISIVKIDSIILWLKVFIASLPGVVFKLLSLDELCDKYFYNPFCVAVALAVFGVGFIIIENLNLNRTPKYNNLNQITFALALYVGFFQILAAAFPGTSRSGATILGALILGASRLAGSEFTFILAIPAMFGASFFEVIDFLKTNTIITKTEVLILTIGFISAFLVSVLVIKFLMNFVKKHNFTVFGYYRIILGIIVLLFFGLR